ncbi:cytochrome c oxidase subunit 8A, mitochondrial [Synchiropus splendidus]|uniref:cytochrome c oxidase subunit 8A, mitochondrial n=1 Tax=Synchiropus splendidus TaxID=270530 RepID=UPI00237EA143|nr:cytochrome c oxidase subunit 8A, mitochondrial [Synchiropus splendidus]
MPGLLRTIVSRATPVLRTQGVTQRAFLHSKPAKDSVGAMETVVGLGFFSLAILGPSGWILAHLEDYKKRE